MKIEMIMKATMEVDECGLSEGITKESVWKDIETGAISFDEITVINVIVDGKELSSNECKEIADGMLEVLEE